MNKRQAKKLSKQRAQARAERSRSYASEYFHTGAEVQSAVNRINSRIRTAEEHFGSDSKIVQDMYTKLDLLIPQENLRYNADGVLQIARPYDLFKNSDAHEVIYNFDKTDIKTYGDIKAEYQKGYDSFRESSEFFEPSVGASMSIDDFITTFSTLADALQWAYDYSDSPEGQGILTIMQQSKKTYGDLQAVINLYKEGVTKND